MTKAKNILLIIGNGFDLSCYLKSSYSDFYKACVKDKYKLHNTIKVADLQNFWQHVLAAYAAEHGKKNYEWCDIENIIKDTISKIVVENDDIFIAKHAYSRMVEATRGFEYTDFKPANEIAKTIFDMMTMFFESECKKEQPPLLRIRDFDQNHINKVTKNLFGWLMNLEKQFCKYLKQQVNNDYTQKALDNIFVVLGLGGYYNNIVKNINRETAFNKVQEHLENTSIISFNYTRSPFLNKIYNVIKYTNVHGNLCDNDCKKCKGTNAIFGIDDTVTHDSNNKDLKIFSKTYRTLQLDQNSQQILPHKDEIVTIKFFGHSLSKADYSYFQSIFDYYNIYDNDKVSLEFLYTDYKNDARLESIDRVYSLVNDYGATLTARGSAQGKNLIHKLRLENRITVKDIDLS